MEREDYFFDFIDEHKSDKIFVLIIYDIVDNSKRIKFSKYLQGYGNRVQKSAFEANISRKKYEKLINEISSFVSHEDSVRVYKIKGKGQISAWGMQTDFTDYDVIVV